MREIQNFLAAILFCTILTLACIETFDMAGNIMESGRRFISGAEGTLKIELFGKLSEEQVKTEQKALYAFSIEELERMLSENSRKEQEGGRYMESVGSIYLFPKSYSGGRIEIYFNDEEDTFIRIRIPVMVDNTGGTYVMVTKLIKKEEFLQIWEEWAGDALSDGFITAEDKKRCGEVIEENWKRTELTENYLEKEGGILALYIAEEGVRMSIREKTDIWREYDYTIDKEYFIGTEIWEYYKQ